MCIRDSHIWDKKEIYTYLEASDRLLRPLNYPKGTTPGKGYTVVEKMCIRDRWRTCNTQL